MPYDFEPRDLDEPRTARRRRRPADEARDAFERWLDESEDAAVREIGGETSQELYELAVNILDPVDISPADATALPLAYPDRVTPDVGLFLSAAYNAAEQDVIAFDVDLPVKPRRIGYRLPAAKTLLLDAPVHSTMAVESEGLVVNRTDIDRYFGYSSDGVFVNAGTCLSIGFETARAFVDVGTVRGQSGATTGTRGIGLDDPAGSTHSYVGSDLPTALASYLDDLQSLLTDDIERVRSYFAGLDGYPCDVLVRELSSRATDHD